MTRFAKTALPLVTALITATCATGIGQGYSTAAIAGRRIHTTGSADGGCVITSLDMDGEKVWTRENARTWRKSYPGTRSTPTVADRALYRLGRIGSLVCLEADNGETVWSVDTMKESGGRSITWGLAEPRLVSGDGAVRAPGASAGGGAGERRLGNPPKAGSADWPRWRGPAATGHVPDGMAVPKTLPAKPKVLWRVPVGDGLGSPVVAGGKVFYLDHQRGKEVVHAAEAETGKPLWSQPLDDVFRDGHSRPGPRGTPLVDGERVYVLSCRGEFRCLRAADGKAIWRVNFVTDLGAVFIGERGLASGASRHGNTGSPFIDGDRMYVDVGGRSGASVVCFDKRTGRVIWKSQSDVAGHGGPVVATIAGVKQVVSFTADGAIGLAADDGKLLWRVPVRTRLGRHCITPVVVDDMVIVSSYLAGLIGIKVTRDGDPFRASRAWVQRSLAINFSSPVAAGHHLYGLSRTRKLICVDVRTGQPTWVKDWTSSRMFGKGYASFLVMRDRVLILAEDGTLLLMSADEKAARVTAEAKVCGKNWCNPAYADGKLYLRDAKALLCVRLLDSASGPN
jgi:outer membrane protein assembly factor BamB